MLFRSRAFPGIRLHCAASNEHARGFYTHYGFSCVGEAAGARGTLLLLEKTVSGRGVKPVGPETIDWKEHAR